MINPPTNTTRMKPSAGHEVCQSCGGLGFKQVGNFGNDRRFPVCDVCKGLGQKYLERV